jgi:hypothetical protein
VFVCRHCVGTVDRNNDFSAGDRSSALFRIILTRVNSVDGTLLDSVVPGTLLNNL